MNLVVLVAVLVGLCLVLLVLQVVFVRARRPVPEVRHGVDPCLGPVTGLPPRPLLRPDDVLQERLLRGMLSQERYRAEMARLAANHPPWWR